jgi:hypothetical protein
LVEPEVRGGERLPVGTRQRVLAGLDARRDAVQRRHRVPDGAHDPALDDPADPVQVDDVVHCGRPHEHPAVELVAEQPLVGEHPEGLPERVARDAERRPDGVLDETRSGREVPPDDPGAGQRLDCHSGPSICGRSS